MGRDFSNSLAEAEEGSKSCVAAIMWALCDVSQATGIS